MAGSELHLYSDIEIVGPTSNILTIDANQRSRIFQIDDRTSTLRDVKISNLRMIGGQTAENGGVILNSETLILIGCTISDSSANEGGGIYNVGTLSIVDSTVAANTAGTSGGGIHYENAHYYFIVLNSTIAGNSAGTSGGGIGSFNGTVVRMANTIVVGNVLTTGAGNDIAGLVQNEASYSMIGVGESTYWTDGFRSSIVGIDWRTVLQNDGTPM